jgi:large subunit ribosomal protein L23
MEPTSVIIKPIVTEKSTWAAGRHNAYTFEVADGASKHVIQNAVESLYNVKVADVRTVVRKGKAKRTRFGEVKKKDRKRAIVTLAGDDRIELF